MGQNSSYDLWFSEETRAGEMASAAPDPPIETLSLKEPIDLEWTVPLCARVMMKVTHVENIHCIYLNWKVARLPDFKRYNYGNEEPSKLEKIRKGSYCLVYHAGDILNPPGHYRGQILEKDITKEGVHQVHLIDIGPVVMMEASKIFTLPQEYYQLRRCAVRFGLVNISLPDSETSFMANECLEKLFGFDLKEHPKDDTHKVIMYIAYWTPEKVASCTQYWGHLYVRKGGDVAQMLITKELVSPCKLGKDVFGCNVGNLHSFVKTRGLSTLYVAKAEMKRRIMGEIPKRNNRCCFRVLICQNPVSFNDFYVMRYEESSVFLEIEQYIQRAASLGLDPYCPWLPPHGSLCLVENPNDKKLYRGITLCIDADERVHIRLLDTGEKVVQPLRDLKEMPSDLKHYPALAHHASLLLTPINKDCERERDFMKRLYKLNQTHGEGPNGLVAVVLSASEDTHGEVLGMDIELVDEGSLLCKSLKDVNEGALHRDLMIQHHLEEIIANQKPNFGKDNELAVGLKNWKEKLPTYGFELGKPPTHGTIRESSLNGSGIDETVRDFHISNLSKLPSLEDRLKLPVSFNRLTGFDIYTVMDLVEGRGLEDKLKLLIEKWKENGEGDYNPEDGPRVNEVVMAPSGVYYRRAKVESLNLTEHPNMAMITYLEYGNAVTIPVSELKKPNRKIFEIPQMVSIIKLEKVVDNAPILVNHFRKLREHLDANAILGPVLSSKSFDNRLHSPCPTVRLYIEEGNTTRELSTLINDLAVWKWRKLYRAMFTTFDELAKEYEWSEYSLNTFLTNSTITSVLKKKCISMKIRIVEVIGNSIILLGIPCDDVITYQSRTLYIQMTLFMKKIEGPDLTDEEVTSYEHILAFSLSKEKVAADKYPTLCSTWHRGFFNKTMKSLFCVDCLLTYGVNEEGKFPGIKVRRLTPDFYDACPGAIGCCIDLTGVIPSKYLRREKYVEAFFPINRVIGVNLEDRVPGIETGFCVYRATLQKDAIKDGLPSV